MTTTNAEVKTKRKFFSKRNILMIGIIMVLLSILACVGSIFFIKEVIWGESRRLDGAENYHPFDGFTGYGELMVFPRTLPETAKVETYFYRFQDTLFDPEYQLFLKYTLPRDEYEKEIERLSKIHKTYREATQTIHFEEKIFRYPTYVTVYALNHTYEYALLDDEENSIICVFMQFKDLEDIEFDEKYLPIGYSKAEHIEDGFNIYWLEMNDGGWYYQ